MYFLFVFMMMLSCCFCQENRNEISSFTRELPSLLQEEKWEEVVLLGEKALQEELPSLEKFIILDQLISSYFRLGLFEEAKEKANSLVILGETLNQPQAVVDSFYKLSAALRGAADSEKDPLKKRELFSECYFAIEKAFTICEEKCSENKALKARVLFNRGALHCDDPIGDVRLGITYYLEAISLFKELHEVDFTQRMLIRLGKAYFLLGDFIQSRQVIEELKGETLEKRTYMHMLYLEAQVCLEEKNKKGALEIALQGKEMAISLHARHDLDRFEILIKKVYHNV